MSRDVALATVYIVLFSRPSCDRPVLDWDLVVATMVFTVQVAAIKRH